MFSCFLFFLFLDGDRGGHEEQEEGVIDGRGNFLIKKREKLPFPCVVV